MMIIFIGAVYCDGNYLRSGMVGEGIASSSVLVVKTHQQNVRVCVRNSLYSIIELRYII